MWLFLLLSCRLFYYGDDEVSQVEVVGAQGEGVDVVMIKVCAHDSRGPRC